MKRSPKQAFITLGSLLLIALLYYFNGSLSNKDDNKPSAANAEQSKSSGGTRATIQQSYQNDGDSFWIDLPDGSPVQYRLYFADAPETKKKSYRDGGNNYKRVRQQAAYFRITDEQSLAVGQEAKEYVQKLLESHPFEIHTNHERVYNSAREYAFVEVSLPSGDRWLHELLVEKGLARIHTKGAKLPDGTLPKAQKSRLLELEKSAKHQRVGAWRF